MIQTSSNHDVRYPIGHGHGSDAIHKDPVYSYAVTELHDDKGLTGVGLVFTLGEGNQLVCEAAKFYAQQLVGNPIEEIMAGFGVLQHTLADEQQFRWLGPHKGVVQLALASVTNACWDLWAKTRGVPLWKLLLDLSPEQIVATLDLSYLEDELTPSLALKMLREQQLTRAVARKYFENRLSRLRHFRRLVQLRRRSGARKLQTRPCRRFYSDEIKGRFARSRT